VSGRADLEDRAPQAESHAIGRYAFVHACSKLKLERSGPDQDEVELRDDTSHCLWSARIWHAAEHSPLERRVAVVCHSATRLGSTDGHSRSARVLEAYTLSERASSAATPRGARALCRRYGTTSSSHLSSDSCCHSDGSRACASAPVPSTCPPLEHPLLPQALPRTLARELVLPSRTAVLSHAVSPQRRLLSPSTVWQLKLEPSCGVKRSIFASSSSRNGRHALCARPDPPLLARPTSAMPSRCAVRLLLALANSAPGLTRELRERTNLDLHLHRRTRARADGPLRWPLARRRRLAHAPPIAPLPPRELGLSRRTHARGHPARRHDVHSEQPLEVSLEISGAHPVRRRRATAPRAAALCEGARGICRSQVPTSGCRRAPRPRTTPPDPYCCHRARLARPPSEHRAAQRRAEAGRARRRHSPCLKRACGQSSASEGTQSGHGRARARANERFSVSRLQALQPSPQGLATEGGIGQRGRALGGVRRQLLSRLRARSAAAADRPAVLAPQALGLRTLSYARLCPPR
jgi:hypothetical protein